MTCADNVVPLYRWEVFEFPWGTAVREIRTGRWVTVVLIGGQEIDVGGMGVILHQNGIEFTGGEPE